MFVLLQLGVNRIVIESKLNSIIIIIIFIISLIVLDKF